MSQGRKMDTYGNQELYQTRGLRLGSMRGVAQNSPSPEKYDQPALLGFNLGNTHKSKTIQSITRKHNEQTDVE